MKFDHVTIRNLFQVPVKSDGFKEYTTPMREAIRRIPGQYYNENENVP